MYRGSVAGSVIQATGTVEFEDGLWMGNHLKAQNGLQRVCTIPGVRPEPGISGLEKRAPSSELEFFARSN